mmetsp:Transcript_13754/g.26653  ORF Transcript_13754/g.26653 Transcript_13754/m.26653 type:complete len:2543 (+) Transcript_13754:61-7689(+)
MVSSLAYPVFNQIRLLVTNLSKKVYKNSIQEFEDIARLYGDDAHLFLLRCLFEEIDFHDQKSQKDHFKHTLLLQELSDLSDRANFASIICRALQASGLAGEAFSNFVTASKLPFSQQILIALGLAQGVDKKTKEEGLKFLKSKMADTGEWNNEKLSAETLHQLVFFIRDCPDIPDQLGSPFISSLEAIYSTEFSQTVMSPLLHKAGAGGVDSKVNHSSSVENLNSLMSALSAGNKASDLLADLGFTVMEKVASLKEVLSQFPTLSAANVAEIIAMMLRTHSQTSMVDEKALPLTNVLSMAMSVPAKGVSSGSAWQSYLQKNETGPGDLKEGEGIKRWRIDNFVQVIKDMYPRIDWADAYANLDVPQFTVSDPKAFSLLLEVWSLANKGKQFPTSIMFGRWKNSGGQFSLINQAMQAPSSVFSFGGSKKPRGQFDSENQPWGNIDLLETLLDLSETDLYTEVRNLFLRAKDELPELLLCGLVQVKIPENVSSSPVVIGRNTLHEQILSALMPIYLRQNNGPMLQRLWNLNSKMVVRWMVQLYLKDRGFLPRILDFALEHNSLNLILESWPLFFAVDLATLAASRDALNLEKWLVVSIGNVGSPFVEGIFEAIRKFHHAAAAQSTEPLPLATVALFFKILMDNTAGLSPDNLVALQSLFRTSCSIVPQLTSMVSASVDDIEEEANGYMRQIYAEQLSLEQAVETLHRFKASGQKREREIYACMVHNLFDEYRCFHKYPVKELRITGQLFGLLIQAQLVSSFTLGIALRYVLEALKHEDAKMFRFGMWALKEFKDRLPQWPPYCTLIVQIPRLRANHPDLIAYLDGILSSAPGSSALDMHALSSDVSGLSVADGLEQTPSLHPPNPNAPSFSDQFTEQQTQPNPIANAPAGTLEPAVEMSRQLVNQVVNLVTDDKPQSQGQPDIKVTPPDSSKVSGPVGLARAKTTPDGLNEVKSNTKTTSGGMLGGFGSAINIDTLLAAPEKELAKPDEAVMDKVKFIVNNVSKTNLAAKAKEFKVSLKKEFYPFFAKYLVTERICRESNFQNLYADFLDACKDAVLSKQLTDTTYDYIKVVLSTNKVLTSANERSVLKNLGSWLGLLTIAKNKPLRANKLSLKQLVLDAYEQGRLIAVIPFVAKVLEACAKSTVFKIPNPWLMALVSLLREIFDLPDLKLNLKFEIEVLFNNLAIAMNDVKPAELLKERVVRSAGNYRENKGPPSPVLRSASADISIGSDLSNLNQGGTNNLSLRGQEFTPSGSGDASGDPAQAGQFPQESTIIPNMPAYVTIHPSITLFNMYPHLKSCVTTAIDRAIREIIQPVVERSVTIAVVTTRELVIKDFAVESDENKMAKSAHQMVQTLTSSLALVTCKEPLRLSINNHLGSLLEANCNSSERNLVEHACIQISTDNLELGCTLIEKAAADRAIREIDEALGSMFQVRRKHRQQTGQPYQDMSVLLAGRFPSSLPEPLRPKPGGLSGSQLRVYEEFANIPTHHYIPQDGVAASSKTPEGANNPGAAAAVAVVSPSDMLAAPSSQPNGASPAGTSPAVSPNAQNRTLGSGTPLTSQQTLDKLIGCLAQLEQAVGRFPNHKNISIAGLAAAGARSEHEINVLLRMIPAILNQCPRDEAAFPREVVAFTFAHKVFKRLYDRDNCHSLLQIETHIQVLKCVWGICPKIVKELTQWLLYSEDERKFMIPITVGLLKARLLLLHDVDLYLAKLVHNINASGQALNPNQTLHPHLEFIVNLVRRAVIKEPIVTVEFPRLFDSLQTLKSSAQQRRTESVVEVLGHLLEQARTAAAAAATAPAQSPVMVQSGSAVQNPAGPSNTAAHAPVEPSVPVGATRETDKPTFDAVGAQLLHEEAAMDRETWDEESPAFREEIVFLLKDWMQICLQGTASDKIYATYLSLLQHKRVLATPENTSRFFLIITQLCIDSAYKEPVKPPSNQGQGNQASQPSYTAIDALSKLVVFLVKFFGESPANGNGNAQKIRMLNAFLRSACRVLRRDYDLSARAVSKDKSATPTFNQRPYFRLFANLLYHLNTPDPSLDSNNTDVLMAFGVFFHLLRPARVPSFCFAWLELISHRMFMSKLLISKAGQCASLFEHLLVDLFEFMQPYLRNADLPDSVRLLYKGALRVLLVLLHDFPEFLCEFHFSFCDVIPSTCVQMRNLILSAFPRNMRLPDPFTPNLKVDLLPDITQPPRILSDVTAQLARYPNLMQPLDSYLSKRAPSSFLPTILKVLVLSDAAAKKAGTKYNVPLINSLVLYVGCQGTTKLSKSGMANQFQDPACMDVFEVLVTSLDAECRYYVLNAIANQLRYPNNHTHYFSCVLLYLFLQPKQPVIKEQITRVLLERLIVHRPHPWGLLITFIELIKNPRYEFWKQHFTRCAPEIERLFESVARSCMPPKPSAGPGGPGGPGPGPTGAGGHISTPNHPPAQHQPHQSGPPIGGGPAHHGQPGIGHPGAHGQLGGPHGTPHGIGQQQGQHQVSHGHHPQQHPHGQHPGAHGHGVPHPGSHIMGDQRSLHGAPHHHNPHHPHHGHNPHHPHHADTQG